MADIQAQKWVKVMLRRARETDARAATERTQKANELRDQAATMRDMAEHAAIGPAPGETWGLDLPGDLAPKPFDPLPDEPPAGYHRARCSRFDTWQNRPLLTGATLVLDLIDDHRRIRWTIAPPWWRRIAHRFKGCDARPVYLYWHEVAGIRFPDEV